MIIADKFRTQNYHEMMTRMVSELKNAKPGDLHSERSKNAIKITKDVIRCSLEDAYFQIKMRVQRTHTCNRKATIC